MSDRIEEWVCAECGQRSCWMGDFMCEKARGANIMPRWRWEMNNAQQRLVFLLSETGWATDGTLLQAVGLVERYATELRQKVKR